MIAQYTHHNQRKWDDNLPELCLAINSSRQSSTKYSPAYLTQGRELRLPNTLFDQRTQSEIAEPTLSTDTRLKNLRDTLQLVKYNLHAAAASQAAHYNLRRRDWTPRRGDLVLLRKRVISKACDHFAAKLAPRFDGPYLVMNFTSPVIVRLADPESRKIQGVAHIKDLKPYHD